MENGLNSHGSEQNDDDDSNNDNSSDIGDEYEDFVVMCPVCGQAFSSESGRLQHDFDNCTEPVSKTMKITDFSSGEQNDSDQIGVKQVEFTDDVMSLQSEYGRLFDGNHQLVGHNDLCKNSNNNRTDYTKPRYLKAPLVPLNIPKRPKLDHTIQNSPNNTCNGASSCTIDQLQFPNKFFHSDNYFHFKKNEIQKKGKNAKDDRRRSVKVEDHDVKLFDQLQTKSYDCDECGRAFVNLQGLSHHKVTHNGSKPYSCACGRSYTTVGNLKAHQKTHSGIKPYSCDQCSKTFTTKQGLIYHRTLHTGDTPFKCDECGKEYAYGVALNAHKKTHLRLRLEAARAASSSELYEDNKDHLHLS